MHVTRSEARSRRRGSGETQRPVRPRGGPAGFLRTGNQRLQLTGRSPASCPPLGSRAPPQRTGLCPGWQQARVAPSQEPAARGKGPSRGSEPRASRRVSTRESGSRFGRPEPRVNSENPASAFTTILVIEFSNSLEYPVRIQAGETVRSREAPAQMARVSVGTLLEPVLKSVCLTEAPACQCVSACPPCP